MSHLLFSMNVPVSHIEVNEKLYFRYSSFKFCPILYKPPFYSTSVDCFGPFAVKIGHRQEKRWGIICKCLTTRCVHLDLLEQMDSDAFLLSLHCFIARCGKPMELLCDNGTNFIGGDRELRDSFEAMPPKLQEQLAEQKIRFRHNPPNAPHFGGTW